MVFEIGRPPPKGFFEPPEAIFEVSPSCH